MSTEKKEVRVQKPSLSANLTSFRKVREVLLDNKVITPEEAKVLEKINKSAVEKYMVKTFGV